MRDRSYEDDPRALRWLTREGARREREAIERFPQEVEDMLALEIRCQRNDLADALGDLGVEVEFIELPDRDDDLHRAFDEIVKFLD